MKHFIALLITALFCCHSAENYLSAGEEQNANRPNIILMMADDLGYGHLGCYGQKIIKTPRLDQFASEGMKFNQFYSGGPACALSRSVLMTGLHGGHTPVRWNSGGIPLADDDVTVAELLQAAGYKTGVFGKWGLGEHLTTGVPYKQGFDQFFGYLHQIHAHFYYPEYLWENEKKVYLEGNFDGKETQYTHDLVVERTMDFIRENQKEPFFVYLPFVIPHYELLAPEDSMQEYRGKFPETPYTGRHGRPAGYPNDYAAQETPKAAIAAMITRMDRNIGRIVDLLEELKIDENTIVIFTSDNGPAKGQGAPEFFDSNGPLRGLKFDMYEGGIRVPTLARWPGTIPENSVSEFPGYFADILPTLAELGHAEHKTEHDGVSFVAEMKRESGQPQSEREGYLYWEFDQRKTRALRLGDWKIIQAVKGGPFELYNLKSDLGETTDLAARYPKKARQMTELLKAARVEMRPQIEPAPPEGRSYQ